MARIDEPFSEDFHGRLVVEEISTNCVEVFYVPSRQSFELSGLNSAKFSTHQVKLLRIDSGNQSLTIYPINTRATSARFLQPKYEQVKCITLIGSNAVHNFSPDGVSPSSQAFMSPTLGPTKPLEDDSVDIDSLHFVPSTQEDVMMMLEALPSAFTKDYDYGLGLAKPYRFIVESVEELSECTELVISNWHDTKIESEEKRFYLSFSDFEIARKSINNTIKICQTSARSVNASITHNLLAERTGRPTIPVQIGRHPLRKKISAAAQENEILSEEDQAMVLNIIQKNVNSIALAEPNKLFKLKHDIELANLEALIIRYREMISANTPEGHWQAFLNENPFVLSLAFGYPVVITQDQASVGGRKFSGSGESIADYMVKNSMTNNVAIVEIKTPKTKLLNETPPRTGIFAPSTKLSEAISQVLDQKYKLEQNFAQLQVNSKKYDIEAYSIHCCLVIGTLPAGEDKLKSFELFRGNSKNVEVITFDELLRKLEQLKEFLSLPDSRLPPQPQHIGPPF